MTNEFKYKFDAFLDRLFVYPWYWVKRGIRNIFVWGKLIWNNDVFDHYYLSALIDKQLQEMEKFWASDNPMTCGKYHIAKRIRWTRKLQQMYKDEYYSMLVFDKHYQSSYFDFLPLKKDGVVNPLYFEMRGMPDDVAELYREDSKKAHALDEKVWNLYIKNLSKMREWWD
jgi:hypothetical protein